MDSTLNLTINGKVQTFNHSMNVAELLHSLDLTGKRVAVEVNGHIIPRGQHAQHKLESNDKIEIIHAVGGG